MLGGLGGGLFGTVRQVTEQVEETRMLAERGIFLGTRLPLLTGISAFAHIGFRYETMLALHLLSVELNGEKVTEMDLDQWTEPNKNPDGSKNKFRTALKNFKREGHIGFQDHGAWVAYRNIRIHVLND